jgi:hypothetical protein
MALLIEDLFDSLRRTGDDGAVSVYDKWPVHYFGVLYQ